MPPGEVELVAVRSGGEERSRRRSAADDTFIMLSEPENIPGAIAALTGAEKGKEYSFTANFGDDCGEEA